MNLELRPGPDPADPSQITMWANGEKVKNARVITAENTPEALIAFVQITVKKEFDEHNEQDQGNLHSQGISEPGFTGKGTGSSSHKASNSK